ncbi:hypothetical protein ATO49_15230 [Mycolicibacterium fortuitum subsp. fortuitum DSM 46621 = ATCC 6841 = JCM 6387]|nr:hypothetical protein ATO49_15230 [Mycolicibacterium fortuitum subsp. fortuitum DSM 46621 = ATCC 6841 = JCM 6387]
MTNNPPMPNANPRPTARQDHCHRKSMRAPFPRHDAMATASAAATNVGTPMARVISQAGGGPAGASTPNAAEVSR